MAYSVCHAPLQLCEMLSEILTRKSVIFLKHVIRSQIIYFSVVFFFVKLHDATIEIRMIIAN